jgi:hypothetical protein
MSLIAAKPAIVGCALDLVAGWEHRSSPTILRSSPILA